MLPGDFLSHLNVVVLQLWTPKLSVKEGRSNTCTCCGLQRLRTDSDSKSASAAIVLPLYHRCKDYDEGWMVIPNNLGRSAHYSLHAGHNRESSIICDSVSGHPYNDFTFSCIYVLAQSFYTCPSTVASRTVR